jgi:hypothetical protein
MKILGLIKLICVLFLFFLFISCEVETEWKFEPYFNNYIIVSGQITSEKKVHKVILSRMVTQPNDIPEPISSASVSIWDGNLLSILKENPAKSGVYETDSNFRAFINKTYKLLVVIQYQRYNSTVTMLPVTPFNPLKYRYESEKNMYTIDSVTQAFDDNESAMYEIIVDWTKVPGYESTPVESKKAVVYYYKLSTIDISEVFKSETEKIFFPKGTSITEKKYSLTKEHAEFLRTLLLETEWRGGLFDVAHGNVKTNLSEGALGFFGASTVVQKTFQVN